MESDLKKLLQNWDGIHSKYLIEIYAGYNKNDKFFDNLIQIYLSDKNLQKATSWLLKHHYDKGEDLTIDQVTKILSNIGNLDPWESQLHILQLIPRFSIDKKMSIDIEPFVRHAMSSENKFVKASAYEAYFEIVKNIPELQREFSLMCEQALIRESASIKSKVRKIITELEKKRLK